MALEFLWNVELKRPKSAHSNVTPCSYQMLPSGCKVHSETFYLINSNLDEVRKLLLQVQQVWIWQIHWQAYISNSILIHLPTISKMKPDKEKSKLIPTMFLERRELKKLSPRVTVSLMHNCVTNNKLLFIISTISFNQRRSQASEEVRSA